METKSPGTLYIFTPVNAPFPNDDANYQSQITSSIKQLARCRLQLDALNGWRLWKQVVVVGFATLNVLVIVLGENLPMQFVDRVNSNN